MMRIQIHNTAQNVCVCSKLMHSFSFGSNVIHFWSFKNAAKLVAHSRVYHKIFKYGAAVIHQTVCVFHVFGQFLCTSVDVYSNQAS
jgi:hypothetical protein